MLIMQTKYLSMFLIISNVMNKLSSVECQVTSVLPTQTEQVNLLTNVHELFEEVKQSARQEQMVMDKSMVIDLELMMKRAKFTIEILQELVLLKLTTRSNAVCALDAKDNIEIIINKTYQKLKECTDAGNKIHGLDNITKNSLHLTNITDTAICHGEEFLDKLNRCSLKRGLAVISCYKKIIQNDVLPVKTVLSEAIKNHRYGHFEAFELKNAVNTCVDTVMSELKDELDEALDEGLHCS